MDTQCPNEGTLRPSRSAEVLATLALPTHFLNKRPPMGDILPVGSCPTRRGQGALKMPNTLSQIFGVSLPF